MNSLPISVCIIARNEEENIDRCLRSIQKCGFEIVVTDTGSTDRTKEIAKGYTDKVYDFKWTDNFSDARNFCAAKAENDWILAIDCDEQICSLDIIGLGQLLDRFPQSLGIIRMKNITNDCNGEKGYVTDDVVRLYNRQKYMFCNPIHEQICRIQSYDRNLKSESFYIPAQILHYGYELPAEKMLEKQQRNLRLLYKNIEQEKDNAYMYFQIGQSEAIIGEYEKAIEAYERGLSLNDDTEFLFVQLMIISLSRVYMKIKRKREAVKLMEKYSAGCNSARYTAAYAEALWNDNSLMKAVVLYMKATMLPDADTLGDELLKCYAHIIQWYVDTGNEKMAELYKGKFVECKEKQERFVC